MYAIMSLMKVWTTSVRCVMLMTNTVQEQVEMDRTQARMFLVENPPLSVALLRCGLPFLLHTAPDTCVGCVLAFTHTSCSPSCQLHARPVQQRLVAPAAQGYRQQLWRVVPPHPRLVEDRRLFNCPEVALCHSQCSNRSADKLSGVKRRMRRCLQGLPPPQHNLVGGQQ